MSHEKPHLVHVKVHYPAAREPFRVDAPPSETVGTIESQALAFFNLHPGPQPDGSNITIHFYFGAEPVTDRSQTLARLGHGAHEMVFKLNQVFTQGAA